MDEHVHEWKWDIVDNDAWFYCTDCERPMGALEIESRLNATEKLSAEMAQSAVNAKGFVGGLLSALRAYANTLEGK